jgi:5-carboxymethyl-2-hydroxymuconate isomerase
MKLLSYKKDGQSSFGVVVNDGVIDVGARLRLRFQGIKGILATDSLPEVRQLLAAATPDFSLNEIEFLPTIPDAEKIICIGVNYFNRNEEYQDSSAPPQYPSVFMRTRESLVGHHQPIVRPLESLQLDYEGEIAIIIGKEGRRISEAAAENHIAGLTIMNEGTIRDWLRHGKFNVTQGKNFERTGSLGPWLVTADEFTSGFDDLRLTTYVNGEERQNDSTRNLLFPFRYLISYLSTFMRLRPGDVIATGTPNGAGARFNPPRYLQPNDVVEVNVQGIGVLQNPVIDEQ